MSLWKNNRKKKLGQFSKSGEKEEEKREKSNRSVNINQEIKDIRNDTRFLNDTARSKLLYH